MTLCLLFFLLRFFLYIFFYIFFIFFQFYDDYDDLVVESNAAEISCSRPQVKQPSLDLRTRLFCDRGGQRTEEKELGILVVGWQHSIFHAETLQSAVVQLTKRTSTSSPISLSLIRLLGSAVNQFCSRKCLCPAGILSAWVASCLLCMWSLLEQSQLWTWVVFVFFNWLYLHPHPTFAEPSVRCLGHPQ